MTFPATDVHPTAPSRPARIATRAMVTLGGMAALSWEVLWQIEASLALGVSAVGTAITLAATMGGLTAGSLAAGRWLERRPANDPLRLYGGLELAIGVSGLLMLPGFAALEALDGRIYAMAPALAPILRLLGIGLLLGPPTFAMGATIPVFQLLARAQGTTVSRLYGLNTAGAALGVMLISFVLLPAFGVRQTAHGVAALNLLVFSATRLATTPPSASPALPAARSPIRGGALSFATARWIVLGTGVATFGLEVAWFRSLRAAFQSTTDSFAIILASVLVPLALGARAVPEMRRRGIGPAVPLALACGLILLATPLVERMDLLAGAGGQLQRWLVENAGAEPGGWLARAAGSYWAICATRLALSLAVLGPAMLFLGTALPWCLEEFAKSAQTGRLYAWNTLGAVSGSLLAAWILLPTLGFARSAWALGILTGILAWRASVGRARLVVAVTAAASLALAAAPTSSPGRDRIPRRADLAGHRIVAFDEGPDSTATVIESPRGVRFLVIDGYIATSEWLGGHYMQWMGRLPMLVHPDPRRALVICFGTGQTADAVRDENPERLDIVELSPAVLRMASHFESNRGVLRDPRVRAITMDGRAWLRRTTERYDVITLEPMPPTFAGVNALYSREFYARMASRLEPGGVAAQWMPLHLLQPPHADAVAATFRDVFPDALLWIDPVSGTGILLGRGPGAEQPIGSEWPGLSRNPVERTLEDRFIRRSVALDPAALARFAAAGRVITDDNQFLAYGLMRTKFWSRALRPMQHINRDRIAKISGRPLLRLSAERLRQIEPEAVTRPADPPRERPAR